MEIIDVINARTSVRRYKKSSSVGEDIIQNLVVLGMRAPSPKNRQPWQVIHVTAVEKEHFVNLGFQVLEQYKERKEHFGSLEISLKAMQTASDILFVVLILMITCLTILACGRKVTYKLLALL